MKRRTVGLGGESRRQPPAGWPACPACRRATSGASRGGTPAGANRRRFPAGRWPASNASRHTCATTRPRIDGCRGAAAAAGCGGGGPPLAGARRGSPRPGPRGCGGRRERPQPPPRRTPRRYLPLRRLGLRGIPPRGVPSTRLGRLPRRMRFSALRYWTMRASSRSVALAIKSSRDWKTPPIWATIRSCPKSSEPQARTDLLHTAGSRLETKKGKARRIADVRCETVRAPARVRSFSQQSDKSAYTTLTKCLSSSILKGVDDVRRSISSSLDDPPRLC
jgi:hypothetical protein